MLTIQEFGLLSGEEPGCTEQLNRQRWLARFPCPRCEGRRAALVGAVLYRQKLTHDRARRQIHRLVAACPLRSR
jgi:hypothetical protein